MSHRGRGGRGGREGVCGEFGGGGGAKYFFSGPKPPPRNSWASKQGYCKRGSGGQLKKL